MTGIRQLSSIHDVDARQWDSLWPRRYPFTRHDFLAALEDSGSCNVDSGWQASHLLLERDGQLLAALPLYVKTHSYGEYVFDWAWADAYHRHGLDYYPKLLNAIPFTPASGPRLGLAAGADRGSSIRAFSAYLQRNCEAQQLSSFHTLFHDAGDHRLWCEQGLLPRQSCQFHWFNRDYADFDQFLAGFNSRKRKALRRERRGIGEAGVSLVRRVGSEIDAADWERFYRFYHTTYLKRSGNSGYLTRDFFSRIGASLADQILMVCARREGRTIAAALCFFDDSHLYGRYWGCEEEVAGLHFETCYYQGIEFAIERGLQVFDPGAQGEHKIQRGFEPVLTHSAHWIADPRFRAAIADFLGRESGAIEQYRDDCARYLPFRQS